MILQPAYLYIMMTISPTSKVFENRLFYLLCLSFLAFSGLLLAFVTKADSFIALNQLHSQSTDFFFARYTFLGDGTCSLVVCAILLFTRHRNLALCVLLAYLSSGLFAQILKHLIIAPRPRLYFETSKIPFYIDFFKTSCAGNNSFPSGHTTSAFALATVLASQFKQTAHTILLFIGALLVGFSRVYTGEHFPLDVWTAMAIGTAFGLIAVLLIKDKVIVFPWIKGRKNTRSATPIFAE